jgi:hypothetical protein
LHDIRVHPEVRQDSPSDQSLDDWQAHETISTAEPQTISTGADGGGAGRASLRQNLFYHAPMHVGEAEVAAGVAIG